MNFRKYLYNKFDKKYVSLNKVNRVNKLNIILYLTNKCNSKCINCNIWNQTPKTEIDIEILKKFLKECNFYGLVLQGGELLLYSKLNELLSFCKYKNIKITILHNGTLEKQLEKILVKYKKIISSICLSIDGNKITHEKIRGIKNYKKNINILKLCKKNKIPTNIGYTFCKENHDSKNVKSFIKIANKYNSSYSFNIAENIDKFSQNSLKKFFINENILKILKHNNFKEYKYINYYNKWLKNKIKIPCISPIEEIIVYSNGDVGYCQYKDTVGNIYKNNLNEILEEKNKKLVDNINCNDCFLSCHFKRNIEINYK